jgi:FkbM family methyltransferase
MPPRNRNATDTHVFREVLVRDMIASQPSTIRRSIKLEGVPPFEMTVHRDGDAFISPYILRDGIWEPCETRALIRLLAADTDFLDIGANIGWYTVLASSILKGRGTVHAFEPDPRNFALLKENVATNEITNARCYNAAVSNHSEGARLFLNRLNMGDHRLYDSNDGRNSISVPTISIDAYDDVDRRRPLIIKLDTQGREVSILRGMNKLLASHPAEIVMICEFWPYGLEQNGSTAKDLIETISGAGFDPYKIDEDSLIKTDWSKFLLLSQGDCAPSTQRHADFVAFRPGSGMVSLVSEMIA